MSVFYKKSFPLSTDSYEIVIGKSANDNKEEGENDTYYGSHGTSASRAENILQHGFALSETGRAGRGVYFWAYISDRSHAKDLAVGWWRFCHNRRHYERDSCADCAVVYVALTATNEQVLDMERLDLKDALRIFVEKAQKDGIDIKNGEEVSKLYNTFIETLENNSHTKYSLLRVRVPQPKKHPYALGGILGHPVCYVVRVLDCITVVEIEKQK